MSLYFIDRKTISVSLHCCELVLGAQLIANIARWGSVPNVRWRFPNALGMIQKLGTCVPYDLQSRDVERRFFACDPWQVMKNGFITATQREESHGDCLVSNAIDAVEPSTAWKTATIRAEETLKWEVLPHPPYSPDIVLSDYYLFRSMPHGLANQQFHSYEDIEKWLDLWIASKDEHITVTVFELYQKDGQNL